MSKIFLEFFSPYIFFLVKSNRYHHSNFCLNTTAAETQCNAKVLLLMMVKDIEMCHSHSSHFLYYTLHNSIRHLFIIIFLIVIFRALCVSEISKEVGPITLEVRCYFSLSSSSSFMKESHSFIPFDT